LKANWDEYQKDYLETFVPIVAESVRLLEHDIVSLPELQSVLKDQFGLNIPPRSLKIILARMKKRGYIKLENQAFVREHNKLATLEFRQTRQQVLTMHEALMTQLRDFAEQRCKTHWTDNEAESALQSYMAENEIRIIAAATERPLLPEPDYPSQTAKFIVASFVRFLQETHSASFEYLETIVKGNMLANAIFLPDPSKALQRFRNTEIYLDTQLLLAALEYDFEPARDACRELRDLLYETGANLRCFSHTFDEVHGILSAAASRMRAGPAGEAYGPTVQFFRTRGYTESDVLLFVQHIARDLERKRIRVVDKPEYQQPTSKGKGYDYRYMIDEKALEEAIARKVQYRKPEALYRDVSSISAIVRLRKGKAFYSVEQCPAVFVTSNTKLVEGASDFLASDMPEGSVSPCLTDYTVTNLLWLKKPLMAPDLPRKRIIADYYAATQPDERLTRRFLREVEKVGKAGNIDPDDVYLLRYSIESRRNLMDITLGQEEAFTEGTVPEILARVRSNIEVGLRSELDAEKQKFKSLESAVHTAQAGQDEIVRALRFRAEKWARMIRTGVEWVLLALLALSTVYAFPWRIPSLSSAWFRYALTLVQAVFLVLGAIHLACFHLGRGTPLTTYMRTAELWLGRRFENWLLAPLALSSKGTSEATRAPVHTTTREESTPTK
jgi:hypothetical protein